MEFVGWAVWLTEWIEEKMTNQESTISRNCVQSRSLIWDIVRLRARVTLSHFQARLWRTYLTTNFLSTFHFMHILQHLSLQHVHRTYTSTMQFKVTHRNVLQSVWRIENIFCFCFLGRCCFDSMFIMWLALFVFFFHFYSFRIATEAVYVIWPRKHCIFTQRIIKWKEKDFHKIMLSPEIVKSEAIVAGIFIFNSRKYFQRSNFDEYI